MSFLCGLTVLNLKFYLINNTSAMDRFYFFDVNCYYPKMNKNYTLFLTL